MIKEIVKDEEFLALPAEPATAEDADVAADLVETLLSLKDNAAGLAANQIGSRKAIIAWLDENDEPVLMFNPHIKQAMKAYRATESCLSLDRESTIARFLEIKVAYEVLEDGVLVAKQGKFKDFDAEVIQHGIDHTKGRLV